MPSAQTPPPCPTPARPCPAQPRASPRLASGRDGGSGRRGLTLMRGETCTGGIILAARRGRGGGRQPAEEGGRWRPGGGGRKAGKHRPPVPSWLRLMAAMTLYSTGVCIAPQKGPACSKISDYKSLGKAVLLAPLQKCPPSLPCSVIANMGSVTRHCAMLTPQVFQPEVCTPNSCGELKLWRGTFYSDRQ